MAIFGVGPDPWKILILGLKSDPTPNGQNPDFKKFSNWVEIVENSKLP